MKVVIRTLINKHYYQKMIFFNIVINRIHINQIRLHIYIKKNKIIVFNSTNYVE